MDWRFVLSLFFAVIVTIFAVQNANTAEVRFLHLELNISQALVILVSAIIGAVTVLLLSIIRSFKLKKKMKELNKVITNLKEENVQFKQALALDKSQHPSQSTPNEPRVPNKKI
ncbi:hypothetical protein SPSYN_00378 [Sporotomaculum syntrophicum]|uniref:Lipopolysaccharide assembly protein A domain-containing protein n=1 Tax=Sporotomaculum syntrophicum TaxID=182264 RepID=A0A9D2WSP2_9FIRM|nr:LapA family protein [Sporotomaculum syntrophicum]KAF1086659.1 hypothetical protein SPSYN_00378 [Sporotomaculum syntrophicum]